MNVMENFLRAEINTQDLYEDIISFITSFHIRNGEFEGNEYIIKKMDQINFIVFSEYETKTGQREIHMAEAVYREDLVRRINKYATSKGIVVKNNIIS